MKSSCLSLVWIISIVLTWPKTIIETSFGADWWCIEVILLITIFIIIKDRSQFWTVIIFIVLVNRHFLLLLLFLCSLLLLPWLFILCSLINLTIIIIVLVNLNTLATAFFFHWFLIFIWLILKKFIVIIVFIESMVAKVAFIIIAKLLIKINIKLFNLSWLTLLLLLSLGSFSSSTLFVWFVNWSSLSFLSYDSLFLCFHFRLEFLLKLTQLGYFFSCRCCWSVSSWCNGLMQWNRCHFHHSKWLLLGFTCVNRRALANSVCGSSTWLLILELFIEFNMSFHWYQSKSIFLFVKNHKCVPRYIGLCASRFKWVFIAVELIWSFVVIIMNLLINKYWLLINRCTWYIWLSNTTASTFSCLLINISLLSHHVL